MDAAVSLHHGALPAATSLPPPPQHHRALHLRHPLPSSTSTRLTVTVTAARPSSSKALPRSSASPSAARAPAPPVIPTHRSTRAATGYAAALADASLRAGTLVRASRHARALLKPQSPREWPRMEPDPRVGALVRMLAGKGKAAMVADVMAEFAAICDCLLPSSAPGAHASSC